MRIMNFNDFPQSELAKIKEAAERFFGVPIRNSKAIEFEWIFMEAHTGWYGPVANVLVLNRLGYNSLSGSGDSVEEIINGLKDHLNKYIRNKQSSSLKFLVSAEKDFERAMSFEEIE